MAKKTPVYGEECCGNCRFYKAQMSKASLCNVLPAQRIEGEWAPRGAPAAPNDLPCHFYIMKQQG